MRTATVAFVLASSGAALASPCSTESKVPVTIAVENTTPRWLVVMWVDDQCREVQEGVLGPGARWDQVTYLSHVWRLRDPQGTLVRRRARRNLAARRGRRS